MREDSEILSNLPEALELYRAVWLILTKTKIPIEEINAQETGLGLIRLRNGHLTRLLETLFRWSSTFRLHTLYHNVFGRIYLKTKTGSGYSSVVTNRIFKGSPLFRHLTGLLSYILLGKNIGRMIVNKI